MSRLQICFASAVCLSLSLATAVAEPRVGRIGGSLSISQPYERGDFWRMGAGVHGVLGRAGSLALGAELSASVGGYTGGWGCGTVAMKPGAVVPAVAVGCFEPSFGAHGLFGYAAGSRTRLRLEAGLGAVAVATIPGAGGRDVVRLHPSGLVRGQLLRAVPGRLAGGDWAIGLQISQQIVGVRAPQTLAAVGLVLEASTD